MPNESADNIIELDNVCFGYEQREVLHHLELKIPKGAFTVIVGPNGSGKTTLLKLMVGLEKPRHGKITVLGQEPEEVRRRIGYVPQSLSFDHGFPATVEDVVLMGRVDRCLFGRYRKSDHDVAHYCLQLVGLDSFGSRPFPALSGGERQRVLIAQAMATEPEILLLDEPGANLDINSSHRIYELLKQLNKSLTIIMVSHNLSLVVSFASHVLCVNHTATIHPIREVSTEAFENGDWVRLFHHHSCPIDHGTGDNLEHN